MLDTNTTIRDMLQQTVIEYLTSNVYTSVPAIILNVDNLASKQTIDVQIAINRTFEDGAALTGAVCLGVPVLFPSGGGGLLSFPLSVGDTVLLCFSKRSIDDWMVGGGETVTPRLNRQFDKADGIAIPCLYTVKNNLNPDPENVVLKFAGSEVVLYKNGNATVNAAGTATVTAAQDINLNAVGNVNITAANVEISSGSLTHNGVNVGETHKHAILGGSSAPGPTDVPQ